MSTYPLQLKHRPIKRLDNALLLHFYRAIEIKMGSCCQLLKLTINHSSYILLPFPVNSVPNHDDH